MAILQISRIQSRRGLQENLPQLASAELGWALDTRKLYIGNGDISEGAPSLGNTEILTVYSNIFTLTGTYTFAGLTAGYTVSTGFPNSLVPVSRSLQDKLDDMVDFRDFGGIGDNSTNNVFYFNNAITQLYNYLGSPHAVSPTTLPASMTYRTLHVPAGTYLLSGDFIRLYPYVKLKGDGKNSTYIIQTDANVRCAISSCDSVGRTGFLYTDFLANVVVSDTQVGSDAGYIEAEDITFINAVSNDVVYLDSVNDVFFDRVAMQGNASVLSSNACVKIGATTNGSYLQSNNLVFRNCDFDNNRHAVYCDNKLKNLNIVNGTANNLYRGISLGSGNASPSISSVRVSSTEFDNVTNEAIYSPNANVSDVVSAFNIFNNVGSAPTYAVSFSGNTCYSFGDSLGSTYTGTQPGININGASSFATLSNGRLLLGTQTIGPGRNISLLSATSGSAGVVGVGINSTILEYSILSSTNQRSGVIKITSDGVNPPIYDDEYVETANVGITLTPTLVGSTIELSYNNIGSAATLRTATRTLI